MDENYWLARTELFLGKEKLENLKKAQVLVVGLGGVGAYVAEHICRSGVGRITIVDNDVVMPSNKNRQLIALTSTLGKSKAELMRVRLLDINPELALTVITKYLNEENIPALLDSVAFDYVVDAIDTLTPKIHLIKHSLQRNYKLISSMGAGGKINPAMVQVADISKTHNDKLARMLRKRIHKIQIYTGFKAVFSPEDIPASAVVIDEGQNKKSTVGTISYMPAIFGIYAASVVVRDLLDAY